MVGVFDINRHFVRSDYNIIRDRPFLRDTSARIECNPMFLLRRLESPLHAANNRHNRIVCNVGVDSSSSNAFSSRI